MPDRSQLTQTEYADHETEIVLGNKQLFSLLFVVFVLLGVFFAMGYVMGRSTVSAEVSTPIGHRESAGKDTARDAGDIPVVTARPSAAVGSEQPVAAAPAQEQAQHPDPTTPKAESAAP